MENILSTGTDEALVDKQVTGVSRTRVQTLSLHESELLAPDKLQFPASRGGSHCYVTALRSARL